MFRKRQKVDRYWLDKDYMTVRSIRDIYELNESQKRLGLITGGEYYKQRQDIVKEIERAEVTLNAFDEMMGKPLDQIDEMMEIFHE